MRLDEQKGHFGLVWVFLEFRVEFPVWVDFGLLAHVSAVFGPYFAQTRARRAWFWQYEAI